MCARLKFSVSIEGFVLAGHFRSRAKITTSRHRNRNDTCTVAYIAVNFCSERTKSQWKHMAKVIFCDASRAAKFACFGPILSAEIMRFASWVAKAHRITALHRVTWRT